MKKILLAMILLLGTSSCLNANEITILESGEGSSDIVEVLIRGNGGYCSAWINSMGIVEETDCIRLTNSKKIKILCTKKKESCKTEKEVFDYLVAKLSSNEQDMQQQKKMTQDKVEKSETHTDYSLKNLRQGMNYSEARKIILNAGWQGNNTRWQDIPQDGQINVLYYNNGWREVVSCSGTGMAPCRYEFHDIYKKTLVVITEGECLNSNNELPKKGEKCELSVSSWFLEN